MTAGYFRPTRRVVDCQAIYNNIKHQQELLVDDTEIFAVVKANGYGHGAIKVATIAQKAGATGFCVALLDEGIELRKAGFVEPILVMGVVKPEYADVLVAYEISATATSLVWLEAVSSRLKQTKSQSPLTIHLKIDTGMGRLGMVTETEMAASASYLASHPEFYVAGIFTHFAKADSADTTYLTLQQTRFQAALALFPNDIPYIHSANSASALWHNHWHSNLIRMGVSMFGLNPSGDELPAPYELEQAMALETELVQVKKVEKGERISYGGTYETQETEWIGTLPIGYADGLLRSFSGFEVLVAGEKAPIIGRVCMDQCMIRLNQAVPVGTKVTIFGKNGAYDNTFQLAADYINTINYEIPCLISERVPLVYLNDEGLS